MATRLLVTRAELLLGKGCSFICSYSERDIGAKTLFRRVTYLQIKRMSSCCQRKIKKGVERGKEK